MIDNDTLERWTDAATSEAQYWMARPVRPRTFFHFVSQGAWSVLPSDLPSEERRTAHAHISAVVEYRLAKLLRPVTH